MTIENLGTGYSVEVDRQRGFVCGTDDGTMQSINLYLPNQNILTVRATTGAPLIYPGLGANTNNSNDFVYNLDSIPYLFRYSENRSYRLCDLADSYTKSVLFAPGTGRLKDSSAGVYAAVVSNGNVGGVPAASPVDTISGRASTTGGSVTFVLVPIQRQ